MTGRFSALIYTDCQAQQGLLGKAGLQFQASSDGLDQAAMAMVQTSLIYEPPVPWMRERRSPRDYPRSFGHAVEADIFATAAGIYLGREVSSGREGNHLTHAIVSRSADAYGHVRPAQLYGASFWTHTASATNVCEPVHPGWQPGPFDAARAQSFVSNQDRGRELLIGLLFQLHRFTDDPAYPGRIMFIARDPELVCQWIASATLLLPQHLALMIRFKVFTTNPAYSRHQIIAVHPDWGAYDIGSAVELGYTVIDLESHEWSRLSSDQRAAAWVDLFLHEDPYDVVDGVELAAASQLGLAGSMALVRSAIIGHAAHQTDIDLLVDWLCYGPRQIVRHYSGQILETMLEEGGLHPSVLQRLHEAGLDLAFESEFPRIRLMLLRAEIRMAVEKRLVVDTILPMPPRDLWRAEDTASAVSILEEAILAHGYPEINLLLLIAKRFQLPVPIKGTETVLREFMRAWIERDDLAIDWRAWPARKQLENILRDEIRRYLQSAPDSYDAVGDRWYGKLTIDYEQIGDVLNNALLSTAVAKMSDRHVRTMLVSRYLRQAAKAEDPAKALRLAAEVLWRKTPPTIPEIEALIARAPANTQFPSSTFASLSARLRPQNAHINPEDVDARLLLIEKGIWIEELHEAKLMRDHSALAEVLHGLTQDRISAEEAATTMRSVPRSLVQGHSRLFYTAILEAPNAATAIAVLTEMPWLVERVGRNLLQVAKGTITAPEAVMAFAFSRPDLLPQLRTQADVAHRMRTVVIGWINHTTKHAFLEASRQIGGLGSAMLAEWKALVQEHRRSWPGNLFRR